MNEQRNGDLRRRPIGELVGQLGSEISTLVRLEVELAKAEARGLAEDLRERAQRTVADVKHETEVGTQRVADATARRGKHAGLAAGMWAGAALFALAGFGLLTAFLVQVLDEAMPIWGASLVVLALYGAVAGVLFALGRSQWRRATPLVPTAELKETAGRVAAAISSGKDRLADAMPPVPEQTIETVKEDIEWAKHPTRSAHG